MRGDSPEAFDGVRSLNRAFRRTLETASQTAISSCQATDEALVLASLLERLAEVFVAQTLPRGAVFQVLLLSQRCSGVIARTLLRGELFRFRLAVRRDFFAAPFLE